VEEVRDLLETKLPLTVGPVHLIDSLPGFRKVALMSYEILVELSCCPSFDFSGYGASVPS
jgi:hypothetical protein